MQIKMRNIIAIIYHFLKNGENFTFRFLPISVHYNFDNLRVIRLLADQVRTTHSEYI